MALLLRGKYRTNSDYFGYKLSMELMLCEGDAAWRPLLRVL